jgi:hypothetical protein
VVALRVGVAREAYVLGEREPEEPALRRALVALYLAERPGARLLDASERLRERGRRRHGGVAHHPHDEVGERVEVVVDRLPAEQERLDCRDARPAERVEDDVALARVVLDVGADDVGRPAREVRVHAVVPGILLALGRNGGGDGDYVSAAHNFSR